jgi:hypothetical protein
VTTQQRTSSIPVVKAALVELFERLFADDEGVEVFYGPANGAAQQLVVVGSTAQNPEQQSWATIGDRQREEKFGLDVFIEIDRHDTTQRVATERAFEVLATIEEAVRADVHLGLAARFRSLEAQVAAVPTFVEWSNADKQGYAARVDTLIVVTTRI